MVKVLPAIFSYEDMKSKWNQDNPDNPYSRRDELQQGIYSLDKWLIRVDDDNRTIATIGWKEYPSHTVVGGLLATHRANKKRPEYEGDHLGKNERALQSAREPQLNQSKPLVAAFGAREGSSEAWIQRGRDRGWVFSKDKEFSQIKSSIPESVTNEWNGAYPNGNWAIRPITDAESLSKWVFIDDPTPSWFSLIKSDKYKMQLGSAGYNVIRLQDNKRLNTIGLSRSQAKHMIADLEAGKDVSQYTRRRKVKEVKGGWKSVLRKWMPSKQDGFLSFSPYKTQDSGNEESKIHRDLQVGKGDGPNKIIVTGHYMNRGKERVGTLDTQLFHWAQTILNSGKPTQRGNWFYMTPNGSKYDFKVLFDMIPKGDILPQQYGQNLSFITNPVSPEVLVFTTIYEKEFDEPSQGWYDMWDEGARR